MKKLLKKLKNIRLPKAGQGLKKFAARIRPPKFKSLRDKLQNMNGPRFKFDDFKAKVAQLRQSDLAQKVKAALPARLGGQGDIKGSFRSLGAATERATNYLQTQGLAKYGKITTVILSTYFVSDLAALGIYSLIPDPPSAEQAFRGSTLRQQQRARLSDYEPIYARNLFNSRGLIPGEEPSTDTPDAEGPAVKTNLPLQLIGTIILRDETRSVATIQDSSAQEIFPVQQNDEIPSKIRIIKIEARKVTFLNLSNRRKEYVDLPDDTAVPSYRTASKKVSEGVKKVSNLQFNVSRAEVDKQLSNLNQILTQARAVPHFVNGQPAGYKLFQIVPNSIYDKLGLKNGDIIEGLNGEPVSDPGKAFQMLNELKTSNHLELTVKRGGQNQTMIYDIN